MSDFAEATTALLDRLAKAGGIVGISNNEWWRELVEDHGEELVMGFVTARRAETRQPVSVAVVSDLCKKEAQRKQDEADDAAEDAAMGRQQARTPAGRHCAICKVRLPDHAAGESLCQQHRNEQRESQKIAEMLTAVPTKLPEPYLPAPTQKQQAAAKPWGLTSQEKDMATLKQLLKSVEDEIKRRGITAKAAQTEMGVALTSIYAWRKGEMSANAQERIHAWLPSSAKLPGVADRSDANEPAPPKRKPIDPASAETVALVKRPKRTAKCEPGLFDSDALRGITRTPVDSAGGELLTQGTNLADALRSLGASGYADVVTALVERLRTVRAALSA